MKRGHLPSNIMLSNNSICLTNATKGQYICSDCAPLNFVLLFVAAGLFVSIFGTPIKAQEASTQISREEAVITVGKTPDPRAAAMRAARASLATGDVTTTQAHIEASGREIPGTAESAHETAISWVILAQAAQASGKPDTALLAARRAFAALQSLDDRFTDDPRRQASICELRAYLLQEFLDDREAAKEQLRRAIARHPDSLSAVEKLSRLEPESEHLKPAP